MTIAAAYLTSEGVVLGADSTTAVVGRQGSGPTSILQLFNYGQKVFEIGEKSHLGLCTWGAGIVGETSHRTIAARLGRWVEEQKSATVAMVAEHLVEMVKGLLQSGQGIKDPLGYYVGGWCPADSLPACFRILLDPDASVQTVPMALGEANFSGAPRFFTRVFRGFDQELPRRLEQALAERLGLPLEEIKPKVEEAFAEAAGPLVAAGSRDIPIREAIDFVYSYLHITVKAYKFQFGAPICGGPIEVAFISSDRPFRWVRHKRFDAAIRGQEADCDER